MKLSNNIRLLRKLRGLNQTEFGAKVQVKSETVSNYEREISKPDIDTIVKMSKFFGVTIDDLVNKDFSNQKNQPITSNRLEEPFVPYGKSNCENKLKVCQLKLEHSESKVELLERHVEVLEKYIEKIEKK